MSPQCWRTRRMNCSSRRVASAESMKKQSVVFQISGERNGEGSCGTSPRLIRWAAWMMADSLAWRNTVARRNTGSTFESIRSRSTLPAPTGGSWSASPMNSTAVSGATALSSEAVSEMSSMELSSTMRKSVLSGLSSERLKPVPWNSSSRWMVLASRPITSAMRWAARPVGAARVTR